MVTNSTPTIRDLYPDFTEQELAEAEDTLARYLTLVLRIFERLELETGPQADPLAPHTVPVSCKLPESSA